MSPASYIFALLVIVPVFGQQTTAWGIAAENGVAVLTKANFKDFIKANRYVFVKFYAPWCGHCKQMAPDYARLAQQMAADPSGIPIAKVDATTEAELSEEYGVEGYPALKLFIDGKAIDYMGPRNLEPLYAWIMKKAGPLVTKLATLDDVKRLKDQKLAVLLVTPPKVAVQLKSLESLAAEYDDLLFYYTESEEAKPLFELEGAFSLVLIRKFDDGNKVLTSQAALSEESMREFIETHRHPWVSIFDHQLAELIFKKEKNTVVLFGEDEAAVPSFFTEVAREPHDNFLFVYAPNRSEMGVRLREYLDVPENQRATARLIFFERGDIVKFRLDEPSGATLRQFLADFRLAKVKPYFKSAPAPEKQDETVKVAVGTTFDELVINNPKNVIVNGYAPWSDESEEFESAFEELADQLEEVPDLEFVKFDASANESPRFSVKGFPTIRLFKAGDKERPVELTGDRSIEGLLAFLETQLERKLIDHEPTDQEL